MGAGVADLDWAASAAIHAGYGSSSVSQAHYRIGFNHTRILIVFGEKAMKKNQCVDDAHWLGGSVTAQTDL